MSTFTDNAWRLIEAPIYNPILKLDFVEGLRTGTLEKEKFEFYIQQDKIYLLEFGKILAMISAKLNTVEDSLAFLNFAKDTVEVERLLHANFLELFSSEKEIEASPSCLLYTAYLHQVFNNYPVKIAVASVLPCFWIYQKVGDYILENQVEGENKYQSWIDTYGGEDFQKAVNKALEITDKLALEAKPKEKQLMYDAFVKASKMEWLFWNSAYKLEKWKI